MPKLTLTGSVKLPAVDVKEIKLHPNSEAQQSKKAVAARIDVSME